MPSLNKVSLIGYLGKDPESQFFSTGTMVVHFSIATTEKWKDKDPVTEWHNIVAFGKLAEICSEYLKKGSFVYVEGRIQTQSWDDEGGNKKFKTEILINTMKMLDKKKVNSTSERDSSIDDEVPF